MSEEEVECPTCHGKGKISRKTLEGFDDVFKGMRKIFDE